MQNIKGKTRNSSKILLEAEYCHKKDIALEILVSSTIKEYKGKETKDEKSLISI